MIHFCFDLLTVIGARLPYAGKKKELSSYRSMISGDIQEMVRCLKLPHPGGNLRQDYIGYISASACGRAMEFLGLSEHGMPDFGWLP